MVAWRVVDADGDAGRSPFGMTWHLVVVVVGAPGFEPGTSASRTLRANQAAPRPAGVKKCSGRAGDDLRSIGLGWRGRERGEDGVGELGTAHEQVGEIRVGLVVDER